MTGGEPREKIGPMSETKPKTSLAREALVYLGGAFALALLLVGLAVLLLPELDLLAGRYAVL